MRGSEDEVAAMVELLRHRGPDGEGMARSGGAIHGHARLALSDPTSASSQPFSLGDGVLSWNGELWGHGDLREELEGLGWTFLTTGDTEVLASALLEWGMPGALDRLDGMFSLAWSTSDGDWLARDSRGKLPLWVARDGPRFTWSSERKAMFADSAGAVQLPAGCALDLRTGRMSRWCGGSSSAVVEAYLSPTVGLRRDHGAGLTDQVGPDDVLEMLVTGVEKRLVADAPVCCLVSGGLDSSLILTLAASLTGSRVEAYTAVVDDGSDDLRWARRLCGSLSVRLNEVRVPLPTAESMSEAVRTCESPSVVQAELSALCLPLAERIRSDGFKACLSGEAADELFGGYGNSIIRSGGLDDGGWRSHREALVRRMSWGNFRRCSNAFLAHGVECRLPFMEESLVRSVLLAGKSTCPPGKGLLKGAGRLVLDRRLVDREKETFQGGSGFHDEVARVIHDPAAFVRREHDRMARGG